MMRLTTLPEAGPGGGPLYWRDETSGVLAKAVAAYLEWRTKAGPAPDPFQVEVLRAYCEQWIKSPVWVGRDLEKLRRSIDTIKLPGELSIWLCAASQEGIDPL